MYFNIRFYLLVRGPRGSIITNFSPAWNGWIFVWLWKREFHEVSVIFTFDGEIGIWGWIFVPRVLSSIFVCGFQNFPTMRSSNHGISKTTSHIFNEDNESEFESLISSIKAFTMEIFEYHITEVATSGNEAPGEDSRKDIPLANMAGAMQWRWKMKKKTVCSNHSFFFRECETVQRRTPARNAPVYGRIRWQT